MTNNWQLGVNPDDVVLLVRIRVEHQPDFDLHIQTADSVEIVDWHIPTLVVETLERKSLAKSLESYLFDPKI